MRTIFMKRKLWKTSLFTLLCLCLVIGMLTPAAASAKTSRTAQITEIMGVVYITKAGGMNSFPGFTGMTLSQGDHIRTGPDSSVRLKMADQEDELTIGSDTDMYISSLINDGGNKTKFSVSVGSLWFKVNKLAGDEDEFAIDTPTMAMSVRGSNGYIESQFDSLFAMMVSGILSTRTQTGDDSTDDSKDYAIYPAQQMQYYGGESNSESGVQPIDIGNFVSRADASVIEQVIAAVQAVRAENEQLAADIQNGTSGISANSTLQLDSLATLNNFTQNLNNLVANIARAAANAGKVDRAQAEAIVGMSLDNVPPFDPTIGIDHARQQAIDHALQAAAAERERRMREREEERQQRAQANADMIQAIQQRAEQAQQQNEQRQREREEQAAAQHSRGMTSDEQERFNAQLEVRQRQLAERQQQQPPPQPEPTRPQPPPVEVPEEPEVPENPDTEMPENAVYLRLSPQENNAEGMYNLQVYLNEFSNLFGVSISVVLDSAFIIDLDLLEINPDLFGGDASDGDRWFDEDEDEDNDYQTVNYAIHKDAGLIEVGEKQLLLTIPLMLDEYTLETLSNIKVKVIWLVLYELVDDGDEQGEKHASFVFINENGEEIQKENDFYEILLDIIP